MITKKPISTISYNSKDFLLNVLNEHLKAHNIEFFMCIFHKGEGGDKDHFHVYIEPSHKIDTMKLQDDTCEFVPGVELPLRCVMFRYSKLDEWVWYNIHNEQYLKSKFEVKEYTYSTDDIFTCKALDDEKQQRIYCAMHSSKVSRELNIQYALSDMSSNELAFRGFLQPREAFYYKVFDEMVHKGQKEVLQKERFAENE